MGDSWGHVGQRNKEANVPCIPLQASDPNKTKRDGEKHNTESDSALTLTSASGHVRIFQWRLWFLNKGLVHSDLPGNEQ